MKFRHIIILLFFSVFSCVSNKGDLLETKNNKEHEMPLPEYFNLEYLGFTSSGEGYYIEDKKNAIALLNILQNRLINESINEIYKSARIEISTELDYKTDHNFRNDLWLTKIEFDSEKIFYREELSVGIKWNLIIINVTISTDEPQIATNHTDPYNIDYYHNDWKYVLNKTNLNNLLLLQRKILE